LAFFLLARFGFISRLMLHEIVLGCGEKLADCIMKLLGK
jgi:hypothetical protein